MALIDRVKQLGNNRGFKGTKKARTLLYGTRYADPRSASQAAPQIPAAGIGPRSVWDGPKKRKNGAPIVKRERSA
jgi:hypothetical protein